MNETIHVDLKEHIETVLRLTTENVEKQLAPLEVRVAYLEQWQNRAVGVFLVVVPLSAILGALIVHLLGK